MTDSHDVFYVDMSQDLPSDLVHHIGHLTILFGRLEHMVLICLKRIQGISLRDAHVKYNGYSLGLKVNGAQICKGAEDHCRHRDAPRPLRSFSDQYPALDRLCKDIQSLIEERNRFMHGLFGFVVADDFRPNNPSLIVKGKIRNIQQRDLHDMEDRLITAILRLNEVVPIPELSVSMVSGGDTYTVYATAAVLSADPLVKKVK